MFYVLDNNNNKVEAFDKEGVLNAINTAIADGSLANLVADAAFISKLKCCVSGVTNKVAFVTQDKYNELFTSGGLIENCYYYITDDTTYSDIVDKLNEIIDQVNSNSEALQFIDATIFNENYKTPYAGESDRAQGIVKKSLTYENFNVDIVGSANAQRIIGGLSSKTYLINITLGGYANIYEKSLSSVSKYDYNPFTASFLINKYEDGGNNTYSYRCLINQFNTNAEITVELRKYNGVLTGLYVYGYLKDGLMEEDYLSGTYTIKVLNAVAIPID